MWWTKLGVSHRASTLTAQAVTSLTHLANFSRERETDRERGREREREREKEKEKWSTHRDEKLCLWRLIRTEERDGRMVVTSHNT